MKIPITDAEFDVMAILWDSQPMSASEITSQLAPMKDWHRKTVNTLLARLVKKGAIAHHKHKSGNRYYPLLQRSSYQKKMAEGLIERMFGGRVAPLVAGFAQEHPLSDEDIEELKTILKELENGRD